MSKKGTYRETDKKTLHNRRKKVLEFYNQGCTIKKIAGYLYWPVSVIIGDMTWLHKQGLIPKNRKRILKSEKVAMTDTERQTQVLKLFQKGLRYVDIAIELNVELRIIINDVRFLRKTNQISKERKAKNFNLIMERRAKVLRFYNQELSYDKIAEQLNIHSATVSKDVKWLRREGQISEKRKTLNLIIERRAKVLELYNQGFSYKQMAEYLNINTGIVSMHIQWLRREGQISKERKKRMPSNLIIERRAEVLALYNQGFSYKQIAEHLNAKMNTVIYDVQCLRNEGKISKERKVRKVSNLNLIMERRASVLELYNQELSYEKIAEHLNVSVATICMDVHWLCHKEQITKKKKVRNLIIERRSKVLELYNQEFSYEQIAEYLNIKIFTVKNDICRLRSEGKITQ